MLVLLTVLATGVSCAGGRGHSQVPLPVSDTLAVRQFLDAARAKDLRAMARVWGTTRGPAAEWMNDSTLQMRMTVVQRYMSANGYKIVEGPLVVPGHTDRRLFRVELQRAQCVHVQPIELVQANRGGWLVYDVHLESANEAGTCSSASGTKP